ncbi:MAG TPA: BNR repeat-containing protein [Hanamia sp.]
MRYFFIFFILFESSFVVAQEDIRVIDVGKAWADNSVNATVFRKNSLVTFRDIQFIAFYDYSANVIIGKRKINDTNWQLHRTQYKGNVNDAHNVICIMIDGAGYLHMAWNQHNNKLHYCRSVSPGALTFTEQIPMTGMHEDKVSYPEFYRLENGNLIFLYRDGGSGRGNLVINNYDIKSRKWSQLNGNLIDGEGTRSAYWQACTDSMGTFHISWVWRETPDVATNHDMCYARSRDGGKTWEKSTGEKYILPITAATAEYACHILQNSELINQTSMFADSKGQPYIVTYWCDPGADVPQYHLIYKRGKSWQIYNTAFRHTAFSLRGMGTKHIPISRPQIISWNKKDK